MNYKEKIIELLQKNLTERAFKLWNGINSIVPDIWDRPTSSTGKHHKKLDGSIPTQAEHVYQMLYSASKILQLFGINPLTAESDKLLLAIAMHDILKYGDMGNRPYTDNMHDKKAADMVASNKETFLKILTEEQFYTMESMIRFHSGKWSTDAKNREFKFDDHSPEVLFTHMLDMLSTYDCLQTDVRE
jgi:hypothetical protein